MANTLGPQRHLLKPRDRAHTRVPALGVQASCPGFALTGSGSMASALWVGGGVSIWELRNPESRKGKGHSPSQTLIGSRLPENAYDKLINFF